MRRPGISPPSPVSRLPAQLGLFPARVSPKLCPVPALLAQPRLLSPRAKVRGWFRAQAAGAVPAPCPSPGQPALTPAETGCSCSSANSGARNPDKSSVEHVSRALPAGSEEPETRAPASRRRAGLTTTPGRRHRAGAAGGMPAGEGGCRRGIAAAPQATSPGAPAGADKERIPSHPSPAAGRALGLIINPGTGKSRSLPLPGLCFGNREPGPCTVGSELSPNRACHRHAEGSAPPRHPETTGAAQGVHRCAHQLGFLVSEQGVASKTESL